MGEELLPRQYQLFPSPNSPLSNHRLSHYTPSELKKKHGRKNDKVKLTNNPAPLVSRRINCLIPATEPGLTYHNVLNSVVDYLRNIHDASSTFENLVRNDRR